MKKRNVIILVILLVIGFASVTTSLILNGTIGIGANGDDFDVYFSEAILDNVDVSADVISSNGKNIDFSTRELTIEGEKSTLEYKVKNASTQYNAEVTINCELKNTNESLNINDYIEFNNSMENQLIYAGEEKKGVLTIKLKKAVVEKMEASVKCEIVANASNRTVEDGMSGSLGEETTYSFSGILLDEEGNPLANKTLVIYPEPVIYVTTDENGYVNIPKISKDHNEIYVVDNNISIEDLKQMTKEEVIEQATSNTTINVNNDNIIFDNGFNTSNVEMKENPVPKSTYSIYGYLENETGDVVPNATLVVYSNTPHYATTDIRGYFYVDGLEDGSHEIYYLTGEINDIKKLNKNEVKEQATASSNITTSSKKIILSNKFKINSYKIEKEIERKYNITLNPNGGTVNSTNKEVIQNQEYGVLPTPTRTGYTFLGWFLDDQKITDNLLVTPDKNHNLEAKWQINTYAINYNLNGGTSSNLPTLGTYNESFAVSTPTRSGYTFNGWTISSGLNTSTAKYGTSSTSVVNSISSATTKINASYFMNLNITNGATVTMTANWYKSSYSVGETVNIGSESFNVVRDNGTTVVLFAKYNITPSGRQSSSNTAVPFSPSKNWSSSSSVTASLYTASASYAGGAINNYVSYLRSLTGATTSQISGTVPTLGDLTSLGCSGSTCVGTANASWVVNGQMYWTRTTTASSVCQSCLYDVYGSGRIKYDMHNGNIGTRPFITIYKSLL